MAEICEAWVDCTGLAAGDCALHALLILEHLQKNTHPVPKAVSPASAPSGIQGPEVAKASNKKRQPPPNKSWESWDLEAQEV